MIKMLIKSGKQIMGSKILILGITFKENCPDIRNSKVADVHNELKEFGLEVDVYDYEANSIEVEEEYGIKILTPEEREVKKIQWSGSILE